MILLSPRVVAQCSVDEDRVGSRKDRRWSYTSTREVVNDAHHVSSTKAASSRYGYLYQFEGDKIASACLEGIDRL